MILIPVTSQILRNQNIRRDLDMLYGAGLAQVPGLARFTEISSPQKIP